MPGAQWNRQQNDARRHRNQRKEFTMRITAATVATVFMLAASGVYAQPVRTEGPTSPFNYEALGATPSIQLLRATAERKPSAGKPATADPAAAVSAKGEPARTDSSGPATKQTVVRAAEPTR
jgi:hypothetical protein